ncbi:two-component sensor histidine kinase [Rhodococcus sp. PAMC28707]|uniref:sensor histidine kinase n=1 Tax=unclassified Rhodococcus (in: high G+C Gram-positive bacteria) TaxID=192944 RepID=UPI00109DF4DA|nr:MULTISPECIES: histidine kinase [unclassified Rhodococcus (in: high G+C Gram-positive bacteria)]QCB51249.1 two-component sensor histidine kinase [Rhodococcus sp. PAMC28705]QCB60583.1 two-component sensor histidine kinase [Rhodococcus sp. PAMC28707]
MIDIPVRRTIRFAPMALVPILLIASTFPGEFYVPLSYWFLGCASAVVFSVGDRAPLVASITLSALSVPLFAAQAWGVSELVPYLGAVSLGEVALRSSRASRVFATMVWTGALVLGAWLDHPDAFWRWTTVASTALFVGLPVLLGLYIRAQRELAATYQERAADAEARTVTAEISARSAERTAVARELHDLVAHHMASIVLRIGVARHVLGRVDPRVDAVLDDVHLTASDALADIRRLLAALREPSLNEVPLVDPGAVRSEIYAAIERTRRAGYEVVADVDADICELDAISRLSLLRIVQESLTNVMKHAATGSAVNLSIARKGAGFSVRIINTGVESMPPSGEGYGVIGMQERIALVGGQLVTTATVDGWELDAWIPATAAAAPTTPGHTL